jgi:hypothetical protein
MYYTKIELSLLDLFFVSCESHRLKKVCEGRNKKIHISEVFCIIFRRLGLWVSLSTAPYFHTRWRKHEKMHVPELVGLAHTATDVSSFCLHLTVRWPYVGSEYTVLPRKSSARNSLGVWGNNKKRGKYSKTAEIGGVKNVFCGITEYKWKRPKLLYSKQDD